MVAAHEGGESAKAARYWLQTQPEATIVFRSTTAGAADEPVAFFTMLALHQMTDADFAADPAAQAIGNYIKESGPLRENEGATCLRFWMVSETYQAPSPLQSLLIVHALRHFLTRGQRLAYTFFCCPDPQSWQAVFDYAEIPQVAEYVLDAQYCGIFGRDWRRVPLSQWLQFIAEKETGAGSTGPSAALGSPSDTHTALTQPEFAASVGDALRHLNHADKLRSSPLLRSHLFAAPASGKPVSPAALKKLIVETGESLNGPNARTQRGYLALRHTYITPAATQEAAAERLGLPFSTYRRHLAEGIAALTAALWQKEINGL